MDGANVILTGVPRSGTTLIVALLLALFLAGCGATEKAQKPRVENPMGRWGYFSGPVETRWDEDGLQMVLLNELRYTDPSGVVWVAPAGARVNGASIPRAFWSLIGGPFEGKYRNAAVLHDVAYEQKSRPWQEVDRMFYHAMRCSGVGVVQAKTMYYALYRHGEHWKNRTRRATTVDGTFPTGPGEVPVTRSTAVTPAEVNEIEHWIQQNDPSLGQIEARATGGDR